MRAGRAGEIGERRPTQPLRGQGSHHVDRGNARTAERPGVISAPMQALVTRINVSEGQQVAKGDLLVVLESMKMENYVYSPANGTVKEIFASPATGVEAGETLLTMEVAGTSKPANPTTDTTEEA